MNGKAIAADRYSARPQLLSKEKLINALHEILRGATLASITVFSIDTFIYAFARIDLDPQVPPFLANIIVWTLVITGASMFLCGIPYLVLAYAREIPRGERIGTILAFFHMILVVPAYLFLGALLYLIILLGIGLGILEWPEEWKEDLSKNLPEQEPSMIPEEPEMFTGRFGF